VRYLFYSKSSISAVSRKRGANSKSHPRGMREKKEGKGEPPGAAFLEERKQVKKPIPEGGRKTPTLRRGKKRMALHVFFPNRERAEVFSEEKGEGGKEEKSSSFDGGKRLLLSREALRSVERWEKTEGSPEKEGRRRKLARWGEKKGRMTQK